MRKLIVTVSMCVLVALAVLPANANSSIFTMTDQNSILQVDTSPSAGVPGAFSWHVDGTNQLYQQWWWYRVGGPGSQINVVNSANLVPVGSPTQLDPGQLKMKFADPSGYFTLELKWFLAGNVAGSGTSDVSEQAIYTKSPNAPADFQFSLFEYSNFDLGGTPNNDTAQLIGANGVRQWDGAMQVEEDLARPSTSWMIGTPSNVLAALGGTQNLPNSQALMNGDVAWAFQWDLTRSVSFSKNKAITTAIPEWSSLFLAAMGMVGTIGIRRRGR